MRRPGSISLPRPAPRAAAVALAVATCAGCRPAPNPPSPPAAAPASASASASAAAAPTAASAGPAGAGSVAPPPSAAPVPSTPAPASAVATTKTDPAWAACHAGFKTTSRDLSRDVAALAAGCARQTGMKIVGGTLTGKQADLDKPQTFALDAKGNHCYRVFARAAEGIKDLDVAVKDSAGVVVAQDSTDDASPVVLENGGVCFSKDDSATVVVSVGLGGGQYALQIWSD
ncbi:MAG TPA: hypothetical protein VE987_18995 [Polyangiaceae bacterium]|nr:hypothetical protein [Polyangiaceae bacterium]